MLAVMPTALLTAWAFGVLAWRWREPGVSRSPRMAGLVFLLVMTAPTLWLRARTPHPYLGRLRESLERPPGPVVKALQKEVRAGEPLAIWGWWPECWVRTGTLLGTRDSNAEFQILPGPLQDYYRARFLEDLRRRPVVFLDAVCPAVQVFRDRAAFGPETFPELARLIARDYTLSAEVAGARIYWLNAAPPAPGSPAENPPSATP